MVENNLTDFGKHMPSSGRDAKTSAIAQVASAFAAKETSTVAEILELVDGLARAFSTAQLGARTQPAQASEVSPFTAAATPAVPLDKAVQQDKVFCLCCGRGFTMLKRHLKAEHQLTEDEYRAKFSLPQDMPLVAPAYSARKADYARNSGLGKHSRDVTDRANS
ncbi:MucR family transcriptional regulator [Aestuariivita sp.]|jgi:predicted transcriptional regulator|uniref:MucR family transcriptional regulator n=1 Tax=Aestuariivita sp. TaxID=1872407 RepID=UPI0025C34B6E|nr:MucR family transcriptional regulator [Aestuariivita sp.]